MKKVLTILSVLFFINSCAHQEPIKLNSTFDENQAKSMLENGKMTFTGEAFLRRTDGGIVTCAGQEVKLIPETQYAAERIFHIYGAQQKAYSPAIYFITNPTTFTPDESAYYNYSRSSICNSQGHFKFTSLNKGKYIIIARVMWGPLPNRYFPEGGNLVYHVELTENNQHVVLTK